MVLLLTKGKLGACMRHTPTDPRTSVLSSVLSSCHILHGTMLQLLVYIGKLQKFLMKFFFAKFMSISITLICVLGSLGKVL